MVAGHAGAARGVERATNATRPEGRQSAFRAARRAGHPGLKCPAPPSPRSHAGDAVAACSAFAELSLGSRSPLLLWRLAGMVFGAVLKVGVRRVGAVTKPALDRLFRGRRAVLTQVQVSFARPQQCRNNLGVGQPAARRPWCQAETRSCRAFRFYRRVG